MTTACKKPVFWSWLEWSVFLFGCIVIVGSLFAWQAYSSFQTFSQTAGISAQEILQLYRDSQHYPLKSDQQRINFLLLGVDVLPDRPADYPLTDTIILASLNLDNGQLNLLTLPRDIYLPEIKNKLNSVYARHFLAQPEEALALTTDFYRETFSLPIHYTLLISLADLHHFLALINGVEVNIVNSFSDHRYPKSGVDVTQVHDPNLLYETISFQEGLAHLDADQALKFIRSRHAEGIEGSDYARSARQQLVLEATLKKVINTLISQAKNYDFTFLGQLYDFYQTYYDQQIPFIEFLALGRYYLSGQHQFQFSNHKLNIAPENQPAFLMENKGDYRTQGMWALMITDRPSLVQEIHTKLDFDI